MLLNIEIAIWYGTRAVSYTHLDVYKRQVLDNAKSHPSEMLLRSNDGQIVVKYLPPNVTALIQPMDQGVIATVKRNYRSSILRKFIEEGNDLKTFFKGLSVLDAIYKTAAAWDKVKPTTMRKSWKKYFLIYQKMGFCWV